VLAALFQPGVPDRQVSLIGIEEPETALHPAAAGVLFDALTEASQRGQVLATTQSDDLFDRDDVDPSVIRAVRSDSGLTQIGPLTPAVLRALDVRQFTAGELMRAGQLQPTTRPAEAQRDRGAE
jgi:predicted ATPase